MTAERSVMGNGKLCAFEIGKAGIAFAEISSRGKARLALKSFGFYPYDQPSETNIRQTLTAIVNENSLKDKKCSCILGANDYKISLLDIPKVEPSEYRDAAKWEIKDVLDFPVDDAIVEVFLPDPNLKGEVNKLHVLAVRASYLRALKNYFFDAGLKLTTIDIREFALRNLIEKIIDPSESVVFLEIDDQSCLLMIVVNGVINFIRRIPLLEETSSTREKAEKLHEEIQRSLDYYANELNYTLPAKFLFAPGQESKRKSFAFLFEQLDKHYSFIDLEDIFPTPKIDHELQSKIYVAVGGVLRKEGD
jgi:MSHA biogenesis protein MshI